MKATRQMGWVRGVGNRGLDRCLRLWRLAVVLFVSGTGAQAAATNDSFELRGVLQGLPVEAGASIAGATHEAGEPNPQGVSPGASLWWEWVAPAEGPVAFSGWGDSVLPRVSVFTGTALTNLTVVASAYGGVNGTEGGFRAVSGRAYFIAVDAAGQPAGRVGLALAPGPENDDFDRRIRLDGTAAEGASMLFGSTLEPGEPVHGAAGERASVWWEWTATASGSVSVHAEAPYAGVTVAVYTGSTLGTLVRLAGDSDGDGWYAQVSVPVTAGETLCIAVASASAGRSSVRLILQPGPANDAFAVRTPLPPGEAWQNGTTLGALTEAEEPSFGLGPIRNSVWYEWSPDRTCGWELRVWAGDAEATATVAAGDSLETLVLRAQAQAARESTGAVVFRAEAGERLKVQVTTPMDGGAPFQFEILAAPDNDDFAGRRPVTGLDLVQEGTTTGATREAGEPAYGSGAANRTVWWNWTAPAAGGYYVEIQDSEAVPFLGVYRGDTLASLTAVAADPIWVPLTLLRRSFHAVAGESFAIVVADSSALGKGVSLTLHAGPANDDFAQAVRLDPAGAPVAGRVLGATAEPGQPAMAAGTEACVWYRWTAPISGGYVAWVSSDAVEGVASLAVYRGEALDGLVEVGRGEWRYLESLAGFRAEAGVDYAIAVSGPDPFWIEVVPTLANDDLQSATALAGQSATNQVAAFLASREAGEPTWITATNAGSLWWRWRAPVTAGYEIEANHAYAVAGLGVFVGDTPQGLEPVVTPLAETDSLSRLHFRAMAGIEYQFGLWVAAGSEGATVVLRPGPINDDFAQRVRLSGSTASHSQTFHGASREPGEPDLPGWETVGSVWYEWEAPASGSYLLRVDYGASTALAAVVWEGTAWPPTDRVVWSPASSWDRRVKVGFAAVAGTRYVIQVLAGAQDADAPLVVQVQPGPANDDFAARALIEGGLAVTPATTLGATREGGEPAHGLRTEGASVWYRWVAPRDGRMGVSVLSSTPHVLGVFTGTTITNLARIVSASATRLTFDTAAGVEYQIAVDTAPATAGAFTLRLAPPPVNDAFADRTLLVGANVTTSSYTLHASVEALEWGEDGAANSIWWKWVAPGNGLARFAVGTAESAQPTLATFVEIPSASGSNVFAAAARMVTNRIAGSFPVMAGRAYDLRVGTTRSDSTNVALALQFEPGAGADVDWMRENGDWLLGGSAGWFAQTAVVRTGPDALQSGPIAAATGSGAWGLVEPVETWIQAVFPGPGNLEFWWRVSSAAKDAAVFSRLSDPPAVAPAGWRLSGVTDWVRVSVDLARRTNVVRWTYARTSAQGGGVNAAWLDDVRLTPRAPQAFGLGFTRVAAPPGMLLRFTSEAQRLFAVERTQDFDRWTTLTNLANLGTTSRTLTVLVPFDPAEPAQGYRVRAE